MRIAGNLSLVVAVALLAGCGERSESRSMSTLVDEALENPEIREQARPYRDEHPEDAARIREAVQEIREADAAAADDGSALEPLLATVGGRRGALRRLAIWGGFVAAFSLITFLAVLAYRNSPLGDASATRRLRRRYHEECRRRRSDRSEPS